jgi:hypothetical protein
MGQVLPRERDDLLQGRVQRRQTLRMLEAPLEEVALAKPLEGEGEATTQMPT